MSADELDCIWKIRKIVEAEPGRLMLSELPDAVRAIHERLERLEAAINYIDGHPNVPDDVKRVVRLLDGVLEP